MALDLRRGGYYVRGVLGVGFACRIARLGERVAPSFRVDCGNNTDSQERVIALFVERTDANLVILIGYSGVYIDCSAVRPGRFGCRLED